jgi:formate hydrogenlyase subunit 3/multisubunit Na+/H+ antiporter MnhD subunit
MPWIRPDAVVLNWLLILPFFAAVCAELFPRLSLRVHSEREAESLRRGPFLLGLLASLMGLLLAGSLLADTASSRPASVDYWWTRDFYHLRFQADRFTVALAALISAIGMLLHTFLAGVPNLSRPHHRAALLLCAQGCALGACLSADLILLVFFLEAMLVCLWLLCLIDSRRAANELLSTAYLGGLFLLGGALLIWHAAGDSAIAALSPLLLSAAPSSLRAMTLLVLLGLLPRIASVPGHEWLRSVAASVPFQGAAPCILLPIAGGAALMKLLPGALLAQPVPGLGLVALFLGVVSLWWGAVRAWMAPTLRQLAAWLTVAQSGLLLISLGGIVTPTASPTLTQAALLHLIGAPLALAAIWSGAGVMKARLGTDVVADLTGSARAAPLSLLAVLLGGLSLAGLPLLPGHHGQRLLVLGLAAEGRLWFSVAIVAADVLIALAVVDVLRRALRRQQPPPAARWSSPWLVLSVSLASVALLALGLGQVLSPDWAEAALRGLLFTSSAGSAWVP